MKHFGDITQLSGFDLPPVDVITGGSPCQDLSVAGKRAGLAGERSGLFMEQIRIVKEMRQADVLRGRSGQFIRPRYMVWENVPGAFSSNGGKDFQAVLEEIVKIVEAEVPDLSEVVQGGWTKSGLLYSEVGRWSIAWRVHDAQFWGVPQRRKRIALVADFGGLTAPEILFERKGLHWDPEPSGEAREGTASGTEGSSDSAICLQGNGIDRADTAGCNGRGWRRGGVTPSIQSTDRECIISFQERAGKPGGAKGFSSSLSGQEPCQPSTISPFLTAGFDGTKGSKARGIGYEVEKAMTTTTSGGALPDTVGALCARDYKGIGNQYVNEGKCIVNNSLK